MTPRAGRASGGPGSAGPAAGLTRGAAEPVESHGLASAGLLRAARRLGRGKQRRAEGRLLAEGPQAVREALDGGLVEVLLATPAAAVRHSELVADGWWEVGEATMASLADTVTPSGLLAVCRWAPWPASAWEGPAAVTPDTAAAVPARTTEVDSATPAGTIETGAAVPAGTIETGAAVPARTTEVDSATPAGTIESGAAIPASRPRDRAAFVVVCDQIRDPGNVGTVLRCADAFGVDTVVLSHGSVDVTNPKAVRASAGSLFHLPVVAEADVTELLPRLRRAGLTVLAADGHGAVDLDELARDGTLAGPVAWLLGNEAWGLPAAERALADHVVRIPIPGRAESLNLAAAAAVCLHVTAAARRAVGD